MRKLLLLPLLFGLVSPAIAHNEANGGCGNHCVAESVWKSNPSVNSNSTKKQKKIINEENNQPSSIDNQVDDNNLNVQIETETKNSMAIYIVIGILLVTIIPLVTWWYYIK